MPHSDESDSDNSGHIKRSTMRFDSKQTDDEVCTSCTNAIIAAAKRQDRGCPSMRDPDYLLHAGVRNVDDNVSPGGVDASHHNEDDIDSAVDAFLDALRRRRRCRSSLLTPVEWSDKSMRRNEPFRRTLEPSELTERYSRIDEMRQRSRSSVCADSRLASSGTTQIVNKSKGVMIVMKPNLSPGRTTYGTKSRLGLR
uniref:Uncharacterized protein n=1 Tax=Ditylum brightwellii TaxID=49249 RepID=A0A7S4W3X9_9STRA|mmetsp:Transcript_25131/g.33326  ORF Transcript_25131/g.33326 Transcript_25131/m.33326 type:complete len:197 (+) Transcript_25131:49-639(+)